MDTPVEHLRDVRTELLVKLFLRDRAGLDNEGLLADAAAVVRPDDRRVDVDQPRRMISSMCGDARAPAPYAASSTRPSTRPAITRVGKPELRLSARNQLPGTVTDVHHGEVMSTVKAVLGGGQPLTAAITKDAAADLDLAPGDAVVVIIKSTEVIVAKDFASATDRR